MNNIDKITSTVQENLEQNGVSKEDSKGIISKIREKLDVISVSGLTLAVLLVINGVRIDLSAQIQKALAANNGDEGGEKSTKTSESKMVDQTTFEEFIEIEDDAKASPDPVKEKLPEDQIMLEQNGVQVEVLNDRGVLRVHLRDIMEYKKMSSPAVIFWNMEDFEQFFYVEMRGRIPQAKLVLENVLNKNKEGKIRVIVLDADDPSTGEPEFKLNQVFSFSDHYNGPVNYDNLVKQDFETGSTVARNGFED